MFTPSKILTLFALSGACCFGALWAQQAEEKPARNRKPEATSTAIAPVEVRTAADPNLLLTTSGFGQYRNVGIASYGSPSSTANQAVKKAVKQYLDSKADSAERDQARDKVAESLGQLYDEHLANQEKQITELEGRLAKLRDQLKRRREAKNKMVDLKLEMVLSQAEGLGWPDNASGDWLSGVEERYALPTGATVNYLVAPSPLELPAAPPQPVIPALPAAEPR